MWYVLVVLRNARQCKAKCAGLFAFWAFHRTAGLVTALLVGSTNVALIGFIGYLHVTTCQVQSELQGMPRSFTINYPPLLSCVRNCPNTCTAHMSAGSTAHLSRPCEYHDQISGCSPCRMNEKSLRSQIWNGHATAAMSVPWKQTTQNWPRLIKWYQVVISIPIQD